MLGVDCVALENGEEHLLCLEQPGRMVVSRGAPALALAKHLPPGHCLALSSNEVEDQVAEVVAHFNVTVREEDLFSRCVLCNGDSFCQIDQETLIAMQEGKGDGWIEVKMSSKAESRTLKVEAHTGMTETGVKLRVDRVPKESMSSNYQFWACVKCGKIYWQGSHWDRTQARLKSWTEGGEGNLLFNKNSP